MRREGEVSEAAAPEAVRRRLRVLIREGKVESARVARMTMAGHVQRVVGYRLVA